MAKPKNKDDPDKTDKPKNKSTKKPKNTDPEITDKPTNKPKNTDPEKTDKPKNKPTKKPKNKIKDKTDKPLLYNRKKKPKRSRDESKKNKPTPDSESTCANDPNFRITYKGKERTCQHIRLKEKYRDTLCRVQRIKKACPQTCGLCCEDDVDFTFRDVKKKERNCDWLSKGNKDRRNEYCDLKAPLVKIRNSCPVACNYCAKPVEMCSNSRKFRVKHQGITMKCANVQQNESRRQELCSFKAVKEECPHACGSCCEDDDTYTFPLSHRDKTVDCKWISSSKNKHITRKAKYCNRVFNGSMVRKKCPLACNFCFSEVNAGKTLQPTQTVSGHSMRSQCTKYTSIFSHCSSYYYYISL